MGDDDIEYLQLTGDGKAPAGAGILGFENDK
jgi:hypothetical protein